MAEFRRITVNRLVWQQLTAAASAQGVTPTDVANAVLTEAFNPLGQVASPPTQRAAPTAPAPINDPYSTDLGDW